MNETKFFKGKRQKTQNGEKEISKILYVIDAWCHVRFSSGAYRVHFYEFMFFIPDQGILGFVFEKQVCTNNDAAFQCNFFLNIYFILSMICFHRIVPLTFHLILQ